jgi:3-oxoacyl-[acyl-carrier-protein] synthase-3
MKFTNLSLEALEYTLPPYIITSAQIENELTETMQRLNLPQGLLKSLTGISERRVWSLDTMPSDAATSAAEKALEVSGINPGEIGCIINTSVCRDYIEPSVSCLVHGNLKLSRQCLNFDISNACIGFFNAIEVISMMIESGKIKYGLIVNGETSGELLDSTVKRLKDPRSTIEDYRNNFASLTLGSAGVAAIIGPAASSNNGHRLNGLVNLADTRYNRLCIGQRDQMTSDATSLMKQGVNLAQKTWKLAERELESWNDDEIDVYIPHQVSQKNIEMLNDVLKITPQKQQLIFMKFGNMGPAAIPVSLKMAEEQGRLFCGSRIAMLGIGSGLNCSMMSMTW